MSNQCDYELSAEEEARMELEYHLNATRWPIEDEGYLEALDTAFTDILVGALGSYGKVA